MTVAAGAALPARGIAGRVGNPVLLVLIVAGAIGVLAGGFVTIAPNRLVSGRPVMLWQAVGTEAAGIALLGIGLIGAAFMPARRLVHWTCAVLAAALLLLGLAAAGNAASALAAEGSRLARVSLGAGFWVLLAASALAIVDALQRAETGPAARCTVAAVLAAAIVLMVRAGMFDALSLAREYRTRHDVFAGALLRHALLVVGSVGPAGLIGFPLGIAVVRRPAIQGPVFAVLNLLQTIPSIALFGLLIGPLAALAAAWPALAAMGIGGIGAAPALIALILYALLPVVRSTVAGIGGVGQAALDAGRGMGMTAGQLFRKVELPLAFPVLFAGLRVVTVQAIGLAVVAALIGAGGLGSFVFEGLGQNAADLILLGALPAILLALAADLILQALAAAIARRYAP